jgi:hypothetical protein
VLRPQVAGINDEAALYEKHQAAVAEALAVFKSGAMGDPEMLAEFETKLRNGEWGSHQVGTVTQAVGVVAGAHHQTASRDQGCKI